MTQIKRKTSQTQLLLRWDMTIKFLVLFALGIALALGFTTLVSWSYYQKNSADLTPSDVYLFKENWIINSTYLSLTLAGTLGGLLCSFLLEEDKILEFPSWAKNDQGLQPGFLGDIFVGIAGAFIAYIALAEFIQDGDQAGITIFVLGLVGGYGGEYLIKTALRKLIERMRKADLTKEKLEEAQKVENLQELANRQIYQGLNPEELSELQTQLQIISLDIEVKEGIFETARDARRLGSRVKAYEARINRTVPIFQALVDSDPNDDRYHAQLACAYRDSVPPKLDDAIPEFNKAIELRKSKPDKSNNWHYELDRVVALIRKASQAG